MSRQNIIISSKQEDVKITMKREIGLTLCSCYDCSSITHLSPQCPKSKREKGACYECGSMTYQRVSCPTRIRRNDDETKKISNEPMNIDVVRNPDPLDEYPVPYEVLCQIHVPMEKYENYCITFSAVVNTGNPISLIKSEFVPNNLSII